jgi:hypothetical protein
MISFEGSSGAVDHTNVCMYVCTYMQRSVFHTTHARPFCLSGRQEGASLLLGRAGGVCAARHFKPLSLYPACMVTSPARTSTHQIHYSTGRCRRPKFCGSKTFPADLRTTDLPQSAESLCHAGRFTPCLFELNDCLVSMHRRLFCLNVAFFRELACMPCESCRCHHPCSISNCTYIYVCRCMYSCTHQRSCSCHRQRMTGRSNNS